MQKALLRRQERLHSRNERGPKRRRSLQPRIAHLSKLLRHSSIKLSKAREGLHRVQVQILLQHRSVVLLGKHPFLRALPQETVQWRLREQVYQRSTAQMPRTRYLPRRRKSPRKRLGEDVGMRYLSQFQGKP